MQTKYIAGLTVITAFSLNAMAQSDSIKSNLSPDRVVSIGGDRDFTLRETTGAVSVIAGDQINRRGAKNIGNDILGQGNGLQSLQGAGLYAVENPTFYVRGLQTLNDNNSPLIVVDGIERDINAISPEEVESVYILKDAQATVLYGVRGINGVIAINTKRGKKNAREITVSYEHGIRSNTHRPDFVDGYTYGLAINEGRANDGLSPRYQSWELDALKSGKYPFLYPDVNWVDETFRKSAPTNKYTVQFRGGGDKVQYYAMINLLTANGFIKNPNTNDGYSTQDKFSRGNVRMNLDIEITPTTKARVNVFGTLSEQSRPGNKADLWDMVYTVPSAAFPIKAENGMWGGSSTWAGTLNPVAQSTAAAYYKNHDRSLFTDLTLIQDLSPLVKGLSAQVRVSYDNTANIYENHSKEYQYAVITPSWPEGASEPTFSISTQGKDSAMGSDAKASAWNRYLHVDAGVNYENRFGDLSLYSQLKWDYDYSDPNGINNTLYRQMISWYSHLSYADRYLLDLTLAETGSNRLAPHSKWAFGPTVGLGWVISNEDFWPFENRYLKLRATAGLINSDFIPKDKDGNWVWSYYTQAYVQSGLTYPFNSGWTSNFGQTALGQMATTDLGREKAYKYNIGIDASPFEGLNLSLDFYKERRNGIWVSSAGKYTSMIGLEAPYLSAGVVDSKGLEISLDYARTVGDWTFSLGGDFNWNTNKIVDMLEEPRLYPNLAQTGHSVGQIYGLEAIGFFKDEADIASSPTQAFSTVRPGDIKYRDINGDNIIDSNDEIAIGRSDQCPEIFYNFRLGAEWKGLGIYGMFQGTGNYTAVLKTKSMYWPLINNTTISRYVYDNRWTPDHQDALFPALSSQSNANNYRTSTLWLRDRSFLKLRDLEVYYNLPKSFLQNTLRVVSDARLFVRATDLFATGDVPENDPECYGIYPVNRSFQFGIKVTF